MLRVCVIVHGSPAVDGERQRHQRMPEQQAVDLRQRQDAGYLAASLGEQVVGSVPEHALDDVAPSDAMKERRVGTARNEVIQRARSSLRERPYLERPVHCKPIRIVGVHAASRSKTRSMRSQRKSLSSCRNLSSVRLRLT